MSLTLYSFTFFGLLASSIWDSDFIKTEWKFQIHPISFWHLGMKRGPQGGLLKSTEDLTFGYQKKKSFTFISRSPWLDRNFLLPVIYFSLLSKLSYCCDCSGLPSFLYKHISDQDFLKLVLCDLIGGWQIWRSPVAGTAFCLLLSSYEVLVVVLLL